jgi:shikimate kinase
VSPEPAATTQDAAAREPARRKLICLAGFMGSGKTTVGRLLARQLGWHFADVDARIVEQTQLSIAEIFRHSGEPAFRLIETEILEQILGEAIEQDRPLVVALGGGTVVLPENMERLRAARAIIIWLDCPVEVLLARCAGIADRPLFRDETSFQELYRQRLPYYAQADFRVKGAAEPEQIVEQILRLGILGRIRA